MSELSSSLDLINSEPFSSDDKSKKEAELFKKGKSYPKTTLQDLKGKRYSINTKLRVYLSVWASLVVSCWLWKVGEILVNNNDKYCLSDSVLNILLGTTTLNVLGIVAIAMYDVFNGKSEDKIE